MIIAFSGLHGSGKSTYARYANDLLKNRNAKLIHIVDLSFFGLISNLLFGKKERENKNSTKQKELSSFYHVLMRSFLYWIDLLIFWIYSLNYRGKKILICDRYFYDKIANFNLKNPFFYVYWEIYDFLMPKPDLTFLIDVDAKEAYRRKSEYEINFFEERNKSYNKLKGFVINKILLKGSLKQNKNTIKEVLGKKVLF